MAHASCFKVALISAPVAQQRNCKPSLNRVQYRGLAFHSKGSHLAPAPAACRRLAGEHFILKTLVRSPLLPLTHCSNTSVRPKTNANSTGHVSRKRAICGPWVICARRHLVLDRPVNPRQLYHLSPAKFAVVLQRCIGEFNCTDAYEGKSPVCSSVTGDQHRACQLHRLIALGGFKGRNAGRPSQGWEVDCSEVSGRRDAKFMSDMADDDRRQFRGLGPSRRVPG